MDLGHGPAVAWRFVLHSLLARGCCGWRQRADCRGLRPIEPGSAGGLVHLASPQHMHQMRTPSAD
eukprot:23815-Eustigmatos_ZCMA.PRE.1